MTAVLLLVGRALAQGVGADEVIGSSQGGQPLVVEHLGRGSTHVLILGNSSSAASDLLSPSNVRASLDKSERRRERIRSRRAMRAVTRSTSA